jgi:hypothetical protein
MEHAFRSCLVDDSIPHVCPKGSDYFCYIFKLQLTFVSKTLAMLTLYLSLDGEDFGFLLDMKTTCSMDCMGHGTWTISLTSLLPILADLSLRVDWVI